jgi:AcrR family transcriptional regulator
MAVPDLLAARRPQRADAQRNFDALLKAAREAFAELGTEASLEDIARRAGVGIGTLYRNFPTREELIESVYVDEVDSLCRYADELGELAPWDALVAWLHRFVTYLGTKRALIDSLNRESHTLVDCRHAMDSAGGPLLGRAQEAELVRGDVGIDDVMRLVLGITAGSYSGDEQRDFVLQIALDGIRARPAAS